MAASHTFLLNQVEGWVTKILREIVPDEELTWAATLQVLPDPSTDNAWVPILVIYVELPISDQNSFYLTRILPPFRLTQELLRDGLASAVADLQARRDAYLAEKAEHGAEQADLQAVLETVPDRPGTIDAL